MRSEEYFSDTVKPKQISKIIWGYSVSENRNKESTVSHI